MAGKELSIFAALGEITSKAELADALWLELSEYSIADLQAICANLTREVEALPSPYREKIRPYFVEQYFLRYGRAAAMHARGEFRSLHGPINDPGLYRDYCRTAAAYEPAGRNDEDPFFGHFYYVISAFFMFVLDEPGHPVGMPFPGGFAVTRRADGYYCPLREKEKDVTYSICNFCPAKQEVLP